MYCLDNEHDFFLFFAIWYGHGYQELRSNGYFNCFSSLNVDLHCPCLGVAKYLGESDTISSILKLLFFYLLQQIAFYSITMFVIVQITIFIHTSFLSTFFTSSYLFISIINNVFICSPSSFNLTTLNLTLTFTLTLNLTLTLTFTHPLLLSSH